MDLPFPDMHQVVGSSDLLWITLDTLRYDVAQSLFKEGKLPHLAKYLPKQGWEKRHSPASFTFAAHQAFFAGFLPTPIQPGKHPRLFATRFLGSESVVPETYVFDHPNIIEGLEKIGYETHCIGGVGFFNKQTPLSNVLPSYFKHSYWKKAFGVTAKDGVKNQLELAASIFQKKKEEDRCLVFINIASMHQPNCFYLDNLENDTIESHAAALEYVDAQLPILLDVLEKQKSVFCMLFADHGTTYGEDGYTGHRIGHRKVWDVPYTHFFVGKNNE